MSASGKRLAILLSGRGSNFIAIADAVANGRLDAEIAIVISNKPEANGIASALARNFNAVVIPSKGHTRLAYDHLLMKEIDKHEPDLICLAGYMRLLSAEFVRQYPHRILNIHPSLLPAFPGLDVQKAALDNGVKYSGCTVHFVDEGLDSGPILKQAVVPVLDTDTVDTLAARILMQEHRIYSEAIALVLSGKWRIEGRRVIELPSGIESSTKP